MFGIESSKDRFNQLKNNYNILLNDTLNISLAEQTCSDAWHLVDWVYEDELKTNPSLKLKSFRENVYKNCPQIKILCDLVNTIKHKELRNPKVKILKTEVHGGPFSNIFSKEFDVSRLTIYYGNNNRIDVDDLIKIVIEYWESIIYKVQ